MKYIVLDTNILVSALLSPAGPPARILDLILSGSLSICFDSRILSEYEAVLSRPKFDFDKRDIKTLMEFFLSFGMSVTPPPLDIPLPDEDDRVFYEVAKHCGTCVVTGNLKHYPNDGTAISATGFLSQFQQV